MDHCQCWGKLSHRLFSNHSLRWRHLEVPVGQLPSKATSADEHVARGGKGLCPSDAQWLRLFAGVHIVASLSHRGARGLSIQCRKEMLRILTT